MNSRSPGVLALAALVGVGVAVAVAGVTDARTPARDGAAGARLVAHSSAIAQAIEAGGSFFTPAEQAVINRKCGYAPGEWDGSEMNISNDVFRCRNGRRVDDPEMRSLLRRAEPRIERRLDLAADRPEVRQSGQ